MQLGKSMISTVATMALVFTAFAGCGDDFNDDFNLVNTLRLLAAKAEPPEAKSGQSVTFTALAVDPANPQSNPGAPPSMIPVNIAWAACTLAEPAGAGLINDDCFTSDTADYLIPLGQGPTFTASVPPLHTNAQGYPDQLGYPDDTFGLYLPIRIRLDAQNSTSNNANTDGGTNTLDGDYRLRMALGAPPNKNPTIEGIYKITGTPDAGDFAMQALTEDTPLVVQSSDKLTLRAHFTDDSAESYVVPTDLTLTTLRNATELLDVTWFATAGHFSEGSTEADGDTALNLSRHPAASGSIVDIWAVGRDGRGGMDFVHRTLMVQ